MEKPIRIVLVEDNPSDVELILYQLKKSGLSFDVETAKSRASFTTLLELFQPDIILSDNSLPGLNAATVVDIKLKKSPHIPVILVSGSQGEFGEKKLPIPGVTYYVSKDKLKTLSGKILQALNKT